MIYSEQGNSKDFPVLFSVGEELFGMSENHTEDLVLLMPLTDLFTDIYIRRV